RRGSRQDSRAKRGDSVGILEDVSKQSRRRGQSHFAQRDSCSAGGAKSGQSPTVLTLLLRRGPLLSTGSAIRRKARLVKLFGGDPNRAVHGNAGTRKNRGEQVSLVSAGFRQETTRMN